MYGHLRVVTAPATCLQDLSGARPSSNGSIGIDGDIASTHTPGAHTPGTHTPATQTPGMELPSPRLREATTEADYSYDKGGKF